MLKGRVCSVGIWDESIPNITFDSDGKSSFCLLQERLIKDYPRGSVGSEYWETLVSKMRKFGTNKKYDCIVGISGGTDSSYLLHLCKLYKLRVLAVTLDNGWSSDIAVKNIKRMTSMLKFDLITYVIDYSEVKAVLRAYMKASLPWIDGPTDMAIDSALYLTAKKEKIKYILNGTDFRTEGKQPFKWTYSDSRQLIYLVNKFEKIKLKSYPVIPFLKVGWFSFIKGIKVIRPYYYLDYSKQKAQRELIETYGWEDYGGHHHENIFTKFVISYWLFEKFGIDKRKISLSAQIMNGDLSRIEALKIIKNNPYSSDEIELQIEYVCKKLDMSREDFDNYFKADNKYFTDYPNWYNLIYRNLKFLSLLKPRALLYMSSRTSQTNL